MVLEQHNMIIPVDLESNFVNGSYRCYGKCLIKLANTKQWRKATMHGSPLYMTYDFELEPCEEYPNGGMHRLSNDCRWNDGDVLDIRLVPDEIWSLPVRQEKLSEHETLVMNLRNRWKSGQKIMDENEICRANDWKIVVVGNDSKYNRIAYSPSLDIMRTLTTSEFYGNSTVD